MKKIIFILLSVILIFPCIYVYAGVSDHVGIILHVSSNGSDSNVGTEDHPFATLKAAKIAARKAKKEGNGSVTVLFHKGNYDFTSGVAFDENDSGTEIHPIIYKSAGDGDVVFRGSKQIDISKFTAVTDENVLSRLPKNSRDKVGQVELTQFGITKEMIDMTTNLTVGKSPSIIGVYLNDKLQSLARWPNSGYVNIADLLNKGSIHQDYQYYNDITQDPNNSGEFVFTQSEPLNWLNATDMYLEGYFGYDWFAEWAKIASIDIVKRTIKMDTWTQFGLRKGGRWAAINLLEEIDMPGEWFIDKNTMIMYYYPSYIMNSQSDVLAISGLKEDLISLNGTKYVIFDGIQFNEGGSNAFELTNTDNIKILNCVLKNIGGRGIIIFGKNTLVSGCEFYNIVYECIWVKGGADMETMTPSGNIFENSHFYNYNLSKNMDSAYAVNLSGVNYNVVGDIVRNNIIHGGYFANGVVYAGNDNQIIYNEIYNVTRDIADAGAIYAGRKLDAFGNKLSYNYIHDYGSFFKSDQSCCGIYWDDRLSGQTGENNIIVANSKDKKRADIIVGRDNTFRYNIIANSGMGVTFDDRGLSSSKLAGTELYNTLIRPRVTPALLAKYPKVAEIKKELDESGGEKGGANGEFIVKNNIVTDNLNVDVDSINIASTVKQYATEVARNEIINDYSMFVDYKNQDWRLTMDAVKKYNLSDKFINEENFSMDKIGIQKDVWDIKKPKTKFVQLYPQNGQENIQNSETYLLWEQALFADQYHYIVARDPELTDIVEEGTVLETSVDLKNVKNGGTYYWKVTAQNISKQIGNSWGNEGKPYVFTVSKYDNLEKLYLKSVIEKADEFKSTIVEGDKEGELKPGTKAWFEGQIELAKKAYQITEGLQAQIDEGANRLDSAMGNIYGQSYLGHNSLNVNSLDNWEIVDADKALMTSGEDFVTLKQGSKTVIANKEKLSNYGVQHFKTKIDMGDGTSWIGFALRQNNGSKEVWESGVENYLIVIKKDIFECQKFGSASNKGYLTTKANNGIVKSGEWYDFEIGALTVENGVEILFKVNGEIIFDYYDTVEPIRDNGYFVIRPGNFLITLKNDNNIPTEFYQSPVSLFETKESINTGTIFDETSKEYKSYGTWAKGNKAGYNNKEILVSDDKNAKAVYNLEGETATYRLYYYHSPIIDGDKNAIIHIKSSGGSSTSYEFDMPVNFSKGESGWREIFVFKYLSASNYGYVDVTITGSGDGKLISPQLRLVSATEDELEFSKLFYGNNGNLLIMQIGNSKAYNSQGEADILDTAPVIINYKTMVPLRFVAESFGGEVKWNEAENTATIKIGDNELSFVLDSGYFTLNGETKLLEQSAGLYNGRILVPLRSICETINKEVYWDETRKLILISSKIKSNMTGNEMLDIIDKALNKQEVSQ